MTETFLFQRLRTWFAPYHGMLAFAVISLVVIALTTSLLPILIKQLIDHVGISQKLEGTQFIQLTIVSLLALRGIASLASNYSVNWVSGKIGSDLRMVLFEKCMALPATHSERPGSEKFTAYFVSDIDQATKGIAQLLSIAGKELFTLIGLLIVMFFLSWEFSLMGLLIALVIGAIIQFISRASNSSQLASGELMNSHILSRTSHTHIKLIKLDNAQSQESEYFRNLIEDERSLALKRAIIKTIGKIIAFLIIAAMLAAFFLLFMQQLSLDKLTVGDACALITAILLLILPLKRLLCIYTSLQNKFRIMRDIDSLLAQQNETDSGNIEIAQARGQLLFEKVSVHPPFQKRPLLLDFTLTLRQGEIIGLTSSGNGHEQVLIDLIARFANPINGRILLDGVDIATLKLTDLRAYITWVTPDNELLNDTIAANIAYGTTRCETEANIMKTARICHVTSFARKMPQGLQTKIDNKNITLTEHQRQCILIARAFLKNPTIVVIDESATLFDTHCTSVNDALDTLIRNRTTLIISSRPAMLEKACRIIQI